MEVKVQPDTCLTNDAEPSPRPATNCGAGHIDVHITVHLIAGNATHTVTRLDSKVM